MSLLLVSIGIALAVVMLGMAIMGKAGKHVNMDRLQIFIALAAGFMIAAVFLELLPENIALYPGGPKAFFRWTLGGIGTVILFERYLLPRLRFVEHFFQDTDHHVLERVDTHDEAVHAEHGGHHHHHNLEEAENCDHSHDHAHIHQHTHLEVLGHGEVCSAIGCFMICSFFDGIALSSVQAVDRKLGIVMILGIILHLLPEGILSGAMALAGGATLKAAKKVLIFIGGSFVVGAFIPHIFSGYETSFLALATGIIMFVDLVQLLPAALKLRFAPVWIGAGILLFISCHALIELGQ